MTKVEVESAKIMTEKKTALQAGDDKVAHQVGEGKDIMSILCTYTRFICSFGHD